MSRLSWDYVLKWERTENILRELNFWLSNIFVTETHVIVYSDASNVAAGANTIELKKFFIQCGKSMRLTRVPLGVN